MYIYYTKRQWKFSSAIHIFRSSRAAGVVRACVLFSPLLQPFYRVCVGVLVSFLLTCAGIPGTNRVRTRYKEVGGWKDIERFLFKWLSKWFREWFKKDFWRCSKDAYLSLHASYPHQQPTSMQLWCLSVCASYPFHQATSSTNMHLVVHISKISHLIFIPNHPQSPQQISGHPSCIMYKKPIMGERWPPGIAQRGVCVVPNPLPAWNKLARNLREVPTFGSAWFWAHVCCLHDKRLPT